MSVFRHTSYNLAGSLIPLILGLIVTPLLIARIGLDRYGLLSICWILLGYFGLFDLGLGRAGGRRIAALTGRRNDQIHSYQTMMSLTLILAATAPLLMLTASSAIVRSLDLTAGPISREFAASFGWLAFALPVAMLNGTLAGALEGVRKFGPVNLVQVGSNGLAMVLPLVAAQADLVELPVLIGAAVLGRASGLIALSVLAARQFSRWPFGIHAQETRELMSFGGWTTVSSIVGPVLVFLDRFLIGRFLGAAAIGIYVVPFTLLLQLQTIPMGLMRALFPKLAADTEQDRAQSLSRAVDVVNFVISFALIIVALTIYPFLRIWVGADLAALSTPVAMGLLIGLWANSLAMVPFNGLQARGDVRFVALLHLTELVPFVTILIILIQAAGPTGAAVAWSVRCMIDAFVIFYRCGVRTNPRMLATSAFVLTSIALITLLTPLHSPIRWILLVGVGAAGGAAIWINRPPIIVELIELLLNWGRRRINERNP